MVNLQPWTGYLNDGTPVEYPSYGCTVEECRELCLYDVADGTDMICQMGSEQMRVQRNGFRWHFHNLTTDERFCIREVLD